jgi:hypothetical protein
MILMPFFHVPESRVIGHYWNDQECPSPICILSLNDNAQMEKYNLVIARYILSSWVGTLCGCSCLVTCKCMVHISQDAISQACHDFSHGLPSLHRKWSVQMQSAAGMICCDKFLHWCQNDSVSVKFLKSCRKWFEASSAVHRDLKEYYIHTKVVNMILQRQEAG